MGGGRPRRITLTRSGSSSRRPGRAPRSWDARSPTGAPASWPATWPATPSGWSRSGGSGCGSCCAPTRSPFSAPGPGRSPATPQRDEKLDRIEEVTSEHSRTAASRSTSSGRCRSGPTTAARGRRSASRPAAGDLPAHPRHPLLPRLLRARRRPTVGHHPAPQGHRPHPGGTQVDPRRPARRRPDLRDLGQPVGQQDPRPSAAGQRATRSSCVSPRPTPPGPTRSRPSSARCAASSLGGSDHPNHPVLARKLQAYLRWRNANARHPEVLAAQRRERARVRSERQRRWGRPVRPAA